MIFLSPSGIFAQGYWQKINSPTTKLLKNLFFTDSLNGWACGSQGIIIHTTDGGNTWQIQNSDVETFIVDIFFLNENRGWALTQRNSSPFGTTILKTTNAGNTWSKVDYFENHIFMNTVFFFDTLNGFLGGSYIAKTTDGGITWIKAKTDSNIYSTLPVYNFDFISRQFGYACGGTIDFAGVIWKTTDYGETWGSHAVSADQVFDMTTLDSSNLIALSGDPEGLYSILAINSSDAGSSWNFEELQIYGLSFSLEFRTFIEGWSASGKKFIYTSDKGINWIEKETPDSSIIYDLQFVDSQTGYAVGDKGIILKFVPPPVNVEDESSRVDECTLLQNYPNPFNPSTKIKYSVGTSLPLLIRERGVRVSLKVYDVLGKEVATLVDEYKPAGIYEVEFNSADLPSGVYFYTLKAGPFNQTRKMLLLK